MWGHHKIEVFSLLGEVQGVWREEAKLENPVESDINRPPPDKTDFGSGLYTQPHSGELLHTHTCTVHCTHQTGESCALVLAVCCQRRCLSCDANVNLRHLDLVWEEVAAAVWSRPTQMIMWNNNPALVWNQCLSIKLREYKVHATWYMIHAWSFTNKIFRENALSSGHHPHPFGGRALHRWSEC